MSVSAGQLRKLDKQDSYINIIKLIATLIVFICHTGIACDKVYGYSTAEKWQVLFKTPAWAGVWIFFIISGYLAEEGFKCGKYRLDRNGIARYYIQRIISIWIPALIFIFIIYVMIATVEEMITIPWYKFLTCTFVGHGALSGIGAVWYVFVIMWLYLLTPLFELAIRKIGQGNKYRLLGLFIGILVIGGGYRIGARILGGSWYDWAYANPIANIDLYFGGMIIHRIVTGAKVFLGRTGRVFGIVNGIFAVLLILNTILYYLGESGRDFCLTIYRYILPSVYMMAFLVLLYMNAIYKNQNRFSLRIVDSTAGYSFQFYLWHSLILDRVVYFMNRVEGGFLTHLKVLFISAVLTAIIALLMTNMNMMIAGKIKQIFLGK